MIQITVPSFPSARQMISHLRAARGELLIVALLTGAAIVPRVVHLAGIPPGLHGDEAWTGIRAQDILDGVNIGPFDRIHGLGQPAGMEYLTAAFVKVFGNSTLTVRLPMALLGAATVPLTYWLARETFDRRTAFLSAALLAVMGWHVHFSRIALPPAGWPFFEVLACLFLVLALRSHTWWQFACAGAALGAGVYTYSSYNVFVIAFAAFAGYWLLFQRLERPRQLAYGLGVTFAVSLLVALPMLRYIQNNQDVYFQYPRQISIFNEDQNTRWAEADTPLKRADVLTDAGREFVRRVVFDPVADFSDGTGYGPMLAAPFSVLLALGIVLALWRWRQPGAALALLVLLIVPWAGILTTGGGIIRRAVGVTPFLAILAALPLAELLRRSERAEPAMRATAAAIVSVAVILVAVIDLKSYFGVFPGSEVGQYVFVPELVAASNYMDELPGEPDIYFYSDRWSFNYETRRYLAAGLTGEDRSREFGDYTLEADRSRDVAYFFLGVYVADLEEVEQQYPGGTPHEEQRGNGQVLFRSYYLPHVPGALAPTPSAGTATPEATPTPNDSLGARQRDATRMEDLSALQQALEAYRQAHDRYPDTGGGIETLCVYEEDGDAGCKLREVLPALPEDPLGDATNSGYFYSSDGNSYTIYARRDSSQFPPCDEHPTHLAYLPSLLCVRGP